MSDAKHTAGELSVRRSNQPVDGEYDYALAIHSDGKWYVMAEAFGRVATDVRLPAAANAARLALAWNMHDELVAACKAWVDYFDKLDRDSEPGDRLAEVRRQFHGARVEATRAALARAGQAVPS